MGREGMWVGKCVFRKGVWVGSGCGWKGGGGVASDLLGQGRDGVDPLLT